MRMKLKGMKKTKFWQEREKKGEDSGGSVVVTWFVALMFTVFIDWLVSREWISPQSVPSECVTLVYSILCWTGVVSLLLKRVGGGRWKEWISEQSEGRLSLNNFFSPRNIPVFPLLAQITT